MGWKRSGGGSGGGGGGGGTVDGTARAAAAAAQQKASENAARFLTLSAFLTNAAGVQQGNAKTYEAIADFEISLVTTAQARRVGFLLPENRTLVEVLSGARDVTNRFVVDGGNARRYVLNSNLRANTAIAYRIRTEASGA